MLAAPNPSPSPIFQDDAPTPSSSPLFQDEDDNVAAAPSLAPVDPPLQQQNDVARVELPNNIAGNDAFVPDDDDGVIEVYPQPLVDQEMMNNLQRVLRPHEDNNSTSNENNASTQPPHLLPLEPLPPHLLPSEEEDGHDYDILIH